MDRWGRPDSVDKGPQLFTAFWQRKRSAGLIVERLYLTFDQRTQVLKAYRYNQQAFE